MLRRAPGIAFLFIATSAFGGDLISNEFPVVAVGSPLAHQTEVKVVSDSTMAMASWVEQGRVRIGRIDFEGTPLDGSGIVVAPEYVVDQHTSALLSDGINFLVLFQIGFGGTGTRLYGRLVRKDATFVTGVFPVSPPSEDVDNPVAVWTGTSYRVFWFYNRVLYLDILPSGLVMAPVLLPLSPPAFYQSSYSIIWGFRPLYLSSQLFGQFLDDLSQFQIPGEPGRSNGGSQGATNGSNFLISWYSYDAFSGPGPYSENAWIARWDMKGVRIDAPVPIASITRTLFGDLPPFGAIPVLSGRDYRIIIFGDTLKVAKVTNQTFICRCLDDAAEVAVPRLMYFSAVPAGTDRIVIAYVHDTPTEKAFFQRAYIRYTRPAPPPRRRAVGK